MNEPGLPKTDSIQVLARFSDDHDMADFDDQFEDVTEPVFERRDEFTVQLPKDEAEAVRREAKARGVAEADLIREWVLERVHAT